MGREGLLADAHVLQSTRAPPSGEHMGTGYRVQGAPPSGGGDQEATNTAGGTGGIDPAGIEDGSVIAVSQHLSE